MDNNCIHFCDTLCVRLIHKHLPSYVTKILNYASIVPVSGGKFGDLA
jgi:hypothetical protein